MTQNAKNANDFILQNHKKWEMEMFAFCVINFEPIKIQTCSVPQNDHLNLSFVKDIHVVGKTRPEMVVKRPFNTLLRFPKKKAVTTRRRSLHLLSYSLFDYYLPTQS